VLDNQETVSASKTCADKIGTNVPGSLRKGRDTLSPIYTVYRFRILFLNTRFKFIITYFTKFLDIMQFFAMHLLALPSIYTLSYSSVHVVSFFQMTLLLK